MPGKKGSGRAAVLKRQRMVLRYFLRGFGPEEIAPVLHVDASTVYRDLDILKPMVHEKVDAAQLRSLKQSWLEKGEIMRELWNLYAKDVQGDRDSPDVYRKLRSLELLLKVSGEFDRIANIGQQKPEAAQAAGPVLDPVKVVVALMEGLPFGEREKAISILRGQVVQEAAPSAP